MKPEKSRPDSTENEKSTEKSSEKPESTKSIEIIEETRPIQPLTVSTNSPTILFTRTTSDRWKYLTDRSTFKMRTTTVKPTTRNSEEITEKTKGRALFTTKKPKKVTWEKINKKVEGK